MTDSHCSSFSLSRSLSLLGLAFATQSLAQPPSSVVYIDQSAPAGGDGSTWAHAFRDVQDALDAVRGGRFGTVLSSLEFRLAQGTYTPDRASGDRGVYFDLDVGTTSASSIYFSGSFAGLSGSDPDAQDFVRTRTVLSGDLAHNDSADDSTRAENSHLILRIARPGSFTSFNGISVRGAFTDPSEGWIGRSGGVRVENGNPFVGDCYFANGTFDDNHALLDGGGIWSDWRLTRFTSCAFRNNVSSAGRGGAFAHDAANAAGYSRFDQCVLQGNRAAQGGAVFSTGWSIVTNGAFADNSAADFGGAIAVGNLRAVGSLFFRNRAPESAAISVANGLGLYHCTISGHSLSSGTVIEGGGELEIDRTLLWNNQSAPGQTLIRYSVIGSWSKISECFFEGGTSFITLPSGTLQYQNVLAIDPQFVNPWPGGSGDDDWRTWNYRLRPGSSAIKKGQNLYSYDINDLDGYPMQGSGSGKTADIGCYYADARICFANFTGWDFLVDDTDFLIFARAYGQGSGPNADMRADLNRDGVVSDADFSIFAAAYDLLVCP